MPLFSGDKDQRDLPAIQDLKLFHTIFGEVAAGKTIEEVAQQLGMDKSNLYRKVKELERALSLLSGSRCVLLDRASGRAARPTETGTEFFGEVDRLLALYSDTLRRDRNREVLRFGVTESTGALRLPMVLRESGFLNDHQNTEIQIICGQWWEILNELRAGRIDFGWGPPVKNGAYFDAEHVVDVKRVLLYHREHELFSTMDPRKFKLHQLADETVLVLPEPLRPELPMRLLEVLPKPRTGKGRRIFLDNWSQMYAFVKHGLGVGIGHEGQMPGDETLIGNLDLSHLNEQIPSWPVYLYLPKGGVRELSRPAQHLIDCIKKSLRGRFGRGGQN